MEEQLESRVPDESKAPAAALLPAPFAIDATFFQKPLFAAVISNLLLGAVQPMYFAVRFETHRKCPFLERLCIDIALVASVPALPYALLAITYVCRHLVCHKNELQ